MAPVFFANMQAVVFAYFVGGISGIAVAIRLACKRCGALSRRLRGAQLDVFDVPPIEHSFLKIPTYQDLKRANERPNARDIGRQYVDYLRFKDNYEEAARVCPELLGNDRVAWEEQVAEFSRAGKMRILAPYIPVSNDFQLAPESYRLALLSFLPDDYERFLRKAKEWSSVLHNVQSIINAVLETLLNNPKQPVLLESLIIFYTLAGQYDQALKNSVMLKHPDVFPLIKEHNLYKAIVDQQVLVGLMDIDITQTVRLLTDHSDHIGTHVDPIILIRKIRNGLQIPGLRDSLVQILQDYNWQMTLRDGYRKIMLSDCYELLMKLLKLRQRGLSVDSELICHICKNRVVRKNSTNSDLNDGVTVFRCKHAFHTGSVLTAAVGCPVCDIGRKDESDASSHQPRSMKCADKPPHAAETSNRNHYRFRQLSDAVSPAVSETLAVLSQPTHDLSKCFGRRIPAKTVEVSLSSFSEQRFRAAVVRGNVTVILSTLPRANPSEEDLFSKLIRLS
ncbi:vacuolar protein sorting-associated protein 41 homolog [Paramacrobiotus metropolitanus]|uniref:vacuolar protein sorting-associated protein 41 homolog n=1 Tax=Paramacrobiotus metropolitanus TaxID=2943436 RepID=UPI0024459EB8|nr:vacuolar protein sorting-associated protein 41 homolog [Paramacrobiotus metropolitanus]